MTFSSTPLHMISLTYFSVSLWHRGSWNYHENKSGEGVTWLIDVGLASGICWDRDRISTFQPQNKEPNPANMRHWAGVVLKSGRRRRHRPDIRPAPAQCLMFVEKFIKTWKQYWLQLMYIMGHQVHHWNGYSLRTIPLWRTDNDGHLQGI